MKVFWIFILAVVLVGASALALRTSRAPSAPVVRPAVKADPTTPLDLPRAVQTPAPTAPVASTPPASPSASPSSAAADAAALHADLASALDAVLQPAEPAPGKVPAAGAKVELTTSPAHPLDQLIKADARKLPDGTLRLDDQFILSGSGTKSDPYVLDFPLLMSAENTYQPRKGLKKLPQRVAFLHDTWIKITGYTAFPIATAEPTEMLVMFNQWDGCCIGTPPTAYDAIEVKLAAPATGESRFAVHGTVVGQFKVDPYIDSNYLLGLYVLENASFASDKTDANLRQQHNQP